MTIDEIMTMWENDSHIDDTDLDNESLKIPNLHQKYLNIYSKEKRKLSDFEDTLEGVVSTKMGSCDF